MAKDPVCGRKITEGHRGGKSEYQGRLYFFCSPDCKRQFEQHPQRYVSPVRLETAKQEQDG